jgi:hypothetical protein
MLGRWLCLGFCAVPIAAIAQQKPVFDPLNPPETAVVEPQRTEHAAGKAAAPVETMVVTPEPEPAPGPVPAAAPVAAPAAVKPAPVAKPLAAPVVPSVPRVVAYDELEAQVGKQIRIRTNLRTQRTGILKRYNRAVLIIEDRSRGFAMDVEIPRPTVVEVTLLD